MSKTPRTTQLKASGRRAAAAGHLVPVRERQKLRPASIFPLVEACVVGGP